MLRIALVVETIVLVGVLVGRWNAGSGRALSCGICVTMVFAGGCLEWCMFVMYRFCGNPCRLSLNLCDLIYCLSYSCT